MIVCPLCTAGVLFAGEPFREDFSTLDAWEPLPD
jgi:hypothetical protein